MSTPKPRAIRLPLAERKQLPLVQAHAFDHYLRGECSGSFPIESARRDLRCPLCFRWRGINGFTVDHAPQWSRQSRLGLAWTTVLTCECNSSAGGDYESEAALLMESGSFDHPECSVHGEVRVAQGFDTAFMDHVEPTTLADAKSAYLIAFAVLGYSWCCSPRLRPLRASLLSGSAPSEADVLVTCGLASDGFPERSVVELVSPLPLILVVGPKREITVAMPSAHTPDVAAACIAASHSAAEAHVFPWPLTVRETARQLDLEDQFVKPEEAWDRGQIFHLDRCVQPHLETVSPLRATTRSANRQFSSDEP